jgi:hypothetical protein
MAKENFDGLTATNCCDDCKADGCVISGKPYCAHPRKGGLHASEMQDADALKRHRSAIAFLARAEAQDKSKRAMADD